MLAELLLVIRLGNTLRGLSLWLMIAGSLGPTSPVSAERFQAECFPLESAWENIEFDAAAQGAALLPMSGSVTVTFNQFSGLLPHFYGFAFAKSELSAIPEVSVKTKFDIAFQGVRMLQLQPDDSGLASGPSYRFVAPDPGTWVIYLVAAVQSIPFLEQRQLQISPKVEPIRGGSIFSGSTLNLAEPLDYKACVLSLDH